MRKFFQNLIHKISGIKISEQRGKDLGRVAGLLILVIFYGFGFFGHAGTDKFVTENLYEALHPLKVHDILGLVIFTAGVCWVTGIIEMIIGEIYLPIGSVWANWAGFAALALGTLLFLV
jgi:hypothetical protein